MKRLALFILFVLSVVSLNAQLTSGNYKDYFREGSFLVMEENFDQALKNFQKAYELDSSSANINYNMGLCYLKSSNQKFKAEYYLAKAIGGVSKTYKMDDVSEKKAPPLALFYYAQSLHFNYKFDDAIVNYDKFAAYAGNDKEWKKELNHYKKQCQYGKELVAGPLNVQITNMGDSINSEYPDFAPVLSADERMMIFTTRRPNSTGGEREDNGMFYEDIVVSYKDDEGRWSKPVALSEYVNTNGHEASINLTPDGQTLIVFKGVSATDGNIYYSQWDGNTWSSLMEFGSDINTKYWESHACLNADGTILYFVSDRPGGFGGRDIYRCVKLPNGKWSKALNLGPAINTEFDEDGAFIHPDGKTFFFSSKGHRSMGGFDIMFSIIDEEGKFSDPFNMGYPINTPDDDVFYVTSPDGKRAYFSSSKDGGRGEKDIYIISIPQATEKPLALFKGQIIPADGENLPDDIVIVVTDKATGEIVGQYRPKIVNGTFTTILPPGKEYNFSYQSHGEEFYNEDVFVSNDLNYQEIKKEITLEAVKLLGKVKVKDGAVVLNVIVLNNSKDKKPVSGAKIALGDKSGKIVSYDTDDKGKKENIILDRENNYVVTAESNGKKSMEATFNTSGIKGSKNITQVIYLDGKVKPATEFKLSLNVTVLNTKTKKPIADANVVISGNDGSKTEVQTDAKGMAKDISLEAGVNYDLIAIKDDASSDKTYLSTANTNVNKVYTKTLYIKPAPVANTSNTNTGTNTTVKEKLGPAKYEHYFEYTKNQIDENEQTWIDFIDRIVALSQKKVVNIHIIASASKVPCMIVFKNNNELAAARAENTKKKVMAAVEAKGGNLAKVKFTKQSLVAGPPWKNDHVEKRTVFEKYQYVKLSAK